MLFMHVCVNDQTEPVVSHCAQIIFYAFTDYSRALVCIIFRLQYSTEYFEAKDKGT